MNKNPTQGKIDTIGNAIALALGLAFLGDLFELWRFDPFDGWWVLFLYIPVACGFLTKGITAGGIMLALTAAVLTIGIFRDTDGRLWGAALIIYLAYLGGRSLYRTWNTPADGKMFEEDGTNYRV